MSDCWCRPANIPNPVPEWWPDVWSQCG